MRGQTVIRDDKPPLWMGLRERGTCDSCAQEKFLVGQYVPTSAYLCRECFAENFK